MTDIYSAEIETSDYDHINMTNDNRRQRNMLLGKSISVYLGISALGGAVEIEWKISNLVRTPWIISNQ